MTERRLLLIDFLNLAFRAYHGYPSLTASGGREVGGVYGFLAMSLSLIERTAATHVAVAFEGGESFRSRLYPGYKAGRGDGPDDAFRAQLVLMAQAVAAMGWAGYAVPGYEADDVLASLARSAAADGFERVFIATGDRDLLGAVDERVTLLWTAQGLGKLETNTFDPAAVLARYGVRPEQIADLKALQGDSSDRIPGCPGVGPKSAVPLIAAFGSLDALYTALRAHDSLAAADAAAAATHLARASAAAPGEPVSEAPQPHHCAMCEVKAGLRAKLAAGEDTARLSLRLARLVADVPLPAGAAEAARLDASSGVSARTFCDSLELRAIARRLDTLQARLAA